MTFEKKLFSYEEKMEHFMDFLDENVLPALVENEEKLDQLYKDAIYINTKMSNPIMLRALSSKVLLDAKLRDSIPKIYGAKINMLKTSEVELNPGKMTNNHFVQGYNIPKMSGKTAINLKLLRA